MCTIIILNQVHPDYPVIIAANRDEFYARRSSPPRAIQRDPVVVAGVDEVKGGSWMGATGRGFFVGLTNQRNYRRSDPKRKSRGEVVTRCLKLGETDAVFEQLRGLEPSDYNPFNLVFGDADQLHVAYVHDGMAEAVIEPVPTGLHVLPNDRLDSALFKNKIGRAHALLHGHATTPWPELGERLHHMLGDTHLPTSAETPRPPRGSVITRRMVRRLEALCIKTPVYGTCSATIAALAPGDTARYLFADGAPDQTPFQDLRALFTPGI